MSHSEFIRIRMKISQRIKTLYALTKMAVWSCWKITTTLGLLMGQIVLILLRSLFYLLPEILLHQNEASFTMWKRTRLLLCQSKRPHIFAGFPSQLHLCLVREMFNLKLTTVDIRKAVVNYLLTLPQISDFSLRESFATLMKHLVRTQKRYYDERPLAQKNSKALDLLGSVASRSLGEGLLEILGDED